MTESPLSRAADAKRRRDLGGEVAAIMGGHRALTGAPWYPSQVGDRLMITYEATEQDPRWTETYDVIEGGEGRVLRHVADTAPVADMAGWYAGPPEFLDTDPIETPWMEAGPDRLTITRGGEIVHQGRHALDRPDTSEVRVTDAMSADGSYGMAVVRTRPATPAENEELERKIIARGAELSARYREESKAPWSPCADCTTPITCGEDRNIDRCP